MAIEHVDIADPEIHEPKGVATAASGEVYKADGAGSGAWGTVVDPQDPAYAQGYIEGSATATTISTINTPVAVDYGGNFNSDSTNKFTISVNGEFTYTGASAVTVHLVASLFATQNSASSVEYTFKVAKNGTAIASTVAKAETGGTVGRSVAVNSLVTVNTNDIITLVVENNTDTTNVTIENTTVSVAQLGF